MINKLYILSLLIAKTKEEIQRAKKSQQISQEDAIEAEGAMKSRYDTFKEEAQYLADAQKIRVIKLESGLVDLERFYQSIENLPPMTQIDLGALSVIEIDDENKIVFFAPFGGGNNFRINDKEVTIITPDAPLARVLWQKTEGDEVTAPIAGANREIFIEKIY